MNVARVIVLSLALGVVSACQQQTGISTEVRSTGGTSPVSYEIEEQSPELARLVKVRQASVDRVNGLWQAQVEIRNNAKQGLALEYRFTWRDAKGMAQPSLRDAWHDVTLAPGETRPLQSVASSPDSAHYIFSLRLRP